MRAFDKFSHLEDTFREKLACLNSVFSFLKRNFKGVCSSFRNEEQTTPPSWKLVVSVADFPEPQEEKTFLPFLWFADFLDFIFHAEVWRPSTLLIRRRFNRATAEHLWRLCLKLVRWELSGRWFPSDFTYVVIVAPRLCVGELLFLIQNATFSAFQTSLETSVIFDNNAFDEQTVSQNKKGFGCARNPTWRIFTSLNLERIKIECWMFWW